MEWLHISACFLVLMTLTGQTLTAVCPDKCVCTTTRDGLHRATCSNLAELQKFTLRQKHHNINILDLSHNNITKLTHELDRLTEVVTLDLSTNGITDLNKFLRNAKKLVHLNLANNRIQELSLTHLPASVSSLDLTNNLLKDVPTDLGHLTGLEHLELEGNPLDCSCQNIRARDRLISANVFIDKTICVTPISFEGRSWLKLKTKDVCKNLKTEPNFLDEMMGDQPFDTEQVGEETTALKSMPLVVNNVLEGDVIQDENSIDDDDHLQFLRVNKTPPAIITDDIEGSGDSSSTVTNIMESEERSAFHTELSKELPADHVSSTDDPIEGSGEGSGFGMIEDDFTAQETTTPHVDELNPERVHKFFEDEKDENSTEFPPVEVPNVYLDGSDWHKHTNAPVTEKAATPMFTPDTTISQKVTKELESKSPDDRPAPHKTGTYVCIAIIVVLLVSLIGFAVIKSQMRKRRDRRILRQQKRDVEKASKEMVDMNKSLLGKPAIVDTPVEKKINGKYELVPTHESLQKKGENGDIANGKHTNGGVRTDSPRDTNQNKNSSKDNNLPKERPAVHETSFESSPDSQASKKDTHSLSSEDLFPINGEDSQPLDTSLPLLNGDRTGNTDYLSPGQEYVPVYSPDMGRVRIKMSVTPKPKTPILVTRSRSNAGDIIITPTVDGNLRKSTT